MSLREFFLNPVIHPDGDRKLKLRDPSEFKKENVRPLFDGLSIKMNRSGAIVLDGDRVVASMARANSIFTDPEYRGRGIGTEMLVAWVSEYASLIQPYPRPMRSEAGAKTYRKAFHLLQDRGFL